MRFLYKAAFSGSRMGRPIHLVSFLASIYSYSQNKLNQTLSLPPITIFQSTAAEQRITMLQYKSNEELAHPSWPTGERNGQMAHLRSREI